MAVEWEPRGEPWEVHAPGGDCGHEGFPSRTAPRWHRASPATFSTTRLLGYSLLRLGKKKPSWQEGTGIQRADPSQIARVRGNSRLGDEGMVGLRQRAADT